MASMARLQPFVLRALVVVLVACVGIAQAGKTGASNQPEEKFKPVDPYTKADSELVRQAGYLGLRPFALIAGGETVHITSRPRPAPLG